jgi:DNA-binding NarL/FixJ family response regulator
MEKTARTRQRILALFMPLTAVLYVGCEALNPKGTDVLILTMRDALKVLPIAARHPGQPQPADAQGRRGQGQRAEEIRRALTGREQDVFTLVAAGMSNGDIADHLHLSAGTVKIHVGRILAKLGLRDRVQAVVLAYESALITPGTQPPGQPRRATS